MIPLFFTITQYTSEVLGRDLKIVQCEGCPTEYVYVIERVSTGSAYTGSILPIPAPDEEAKTLAATMAQDGLKSLLKEEYDPIPCPMCGNYQKHMFPKLLPPPSGAYSTASLTAFLVGLAAAMGALWSLLRSGPAQTIVLGSVSVAMAAVVLVITVWDKRRIARFDPNHESDRSSRLELAKARAMTRSEFEASLRHRKANEPV